MQDSESSSSLVNEPQSPAIQLSAIELRVLGSLMEKQLTTPDQYPLTLNSLLSACNQKSSREPVTNYQQGEVVRTLQLLEDKKLVRRELGSRSDKYSQQLINHIEQGKKQQGLLCVMMLRGPQTESELQTRTQRMDLFSDRGELVHCLERLCDRQTPYVVRLGHLPGQRGERFGHLFSGMPELKVTKTEALRAEATASRVDDDDSASLLALDIAELNDEIRSLRASNAELKSQLEKLYELTGYGDQLSVKN